MKRHNKPSNPQKKLAIPAQAIRELTQDDIEQGAGGLQHPSFETEARKC